MYILCRVTELFFFILNLLLFNMFTQDVNKLKSIGSLYNQNNEQSWLTDGKWTTKNS